MKTIFALIGTGMAMGFSSIAQDLYWDTNDSTAGSGNAGGTWDAGTTWTTDSGGAMGAISWVDGRKAIFSAGTDGTGSWTVTVNGTVAPTEIHFAQDGSKTINNGTILTTGGISISSAGRSNSHTFSIGSKLSGNGGITLAANGDTSNSGGGVGGNLALKNMGNDFSGTIRITSGVVSFDGDGVFGDVNNVIEIAGGGLVAVANRTLPGTRAIVLSGGGDKVFRVYGSATFTVNGSVSGTGNIKHTDGGTLSLAGVLTHDGKVSASDSGTVTALANSGNSYTGITHAFGGGTIRLDANNVIPDTSTVLLYAGTFDVNGKTETIRSLTTGSSSDTGAIIHLGSGGNLTVTHNDLPSGMTTGYSVATVHGKITGTGDITYAHANTHNGLWNWMNTANSFTGDVTLRQGRLRVVNDATLGNLTNDLIFDGDVVATLGDNQGRASIQVVNGNDPTWKNLTLNADRNVILNAGKEGTMYVWGGTTMTINGKVTGGGNLRKEDTGTLLLTNTSNDYTGLTKIAMGQIRLGNDNVLPDATEVVIGNNGVLNLNGKADTVKGLSGNGENGGQISNGGILTVNGSGSYTYEGKIITGATVSYAGTGSLTLAGNQDNGGGWAKVESGTLILAKASTESVHAVGRIDGVGLWITGGTARLAGTGNDQIYTDTHVEMTGGVLDMNDRNEGFRALKGSGGTVLNNGSGASTLTIGERSVSADSYTFGGTLADGTGTLHLTKTGAGTVTLAGTNTYTGETHVNEGTLLVNGTHNSSAGLIQIAAGATIGGSGTAGDVSVAGGATLAPGNSAGTLTVRDLLLEDITNLNYELGAPNLGANIGSDRVDVQRHLQLGGILNITPIAGFDPLAVVPGDRWLLMTYPSGNLDDRGVNLGSAPVLNAGLSFEVDTSNDTEVFLVVVPEASTGMLAVLGLLLFLRRRVA